ALRTIPSVMLGKRDSLCIAGSTVTVVRPARSPFATASPPCSKNKKTKHTHRSREPIHFAIRPRSFGSGKISPEPPDHTHLLSSVLRNALRNECTDQATRANCCECHRSSRFRLQYPDALLPDPRALRIRRLDKARPS